MPANKQLSEHNRFQQEYFGESVKTTMIPADTPYIRKQVQRLIEFSGLRPGSRLLEVGAGMGRHAIPLFEMGYNIEGLELSEYLIDQFNLFNQNGYDIPVHQADIHSPTDEIKPPFDGVIGFFVLHHLHDLSKSFQSMQKLLKPGGVVAFIEPNPNNLLYYLQIIFTPGMKWKAEKNIWQMRPKKIALELEMAGLTEFKIKRFGFFPRLIANTRGGSKLETTLEKQILLQPFLPFQVFYAKKPN